MLLRSYSTDVVFILGTGYLYLRVLRLCTGEVCCKRTRHRGNKQKHVELLVSKQDVSIPDRAQRKQHSHSDMRTRRMVVGGGCFEGCSPKRRIGIRPELSGRIHIHFNGNLFS